jgi:LysM repeat protein
MATPKIQILIEHTGEKFHVMFNPEEYTLNKDNNFASHAVPGLSSPLLQFVHGNLRTLEMELMFDTYLPLTTEARPTRDVREETQRVLKLLEIDGELHAPPVVQVSWASLQFRGVLAKATQKFIMFLPDGRPVRAKLNVTFNEFIDADREAKEVNRQTADLTKTHTVTQGDTLSAIAARYYENPRQWRPIAIASGIDDPRELAVGQLLQIPKLPFADPDSGEVLT